MICSYSEAINILYANNRLSFDIPKCIIYLPRLLLPQRIASIRDLHVVWWLCDPPRPGTPHHREWISFWQALNALSGLRKLKVDLETPMASYREWMQQEAQLLDCVDVFERPEILTVFAAWRSVDEELPRRKYQMSFMREDFFT
jgi:hypothetical protein